MSSKSYAQLASKRQRTISSDFLDEYDCLKRPHSAHSIKSLKSTAQRNDYLSSLQLKEEALDVSKSVSNLKLDSRANRRQQELSEHLKLSVKKYKSALDVAQRERKQAEERSSRTSMECQEWRSRFKSSELNLAHLGLSLKNELKEREMAHQREANRLRLMCETRTREVEGKQAAQQQYAAQLKQLNEELTHSNEALQHKYGESALRESSLQNKLESSMKRALAIQDSLSQRLTAMQSESSQSETKLAHDAQRLQNLVSIKESDVAFLRSSLREERESAQRKQAELKAAHAQQLAALQRDHSALNKELQAIERRKEEFARSSATASEALTRALSEYASERESLQRLHMGELERKGKEERELKATLERQQAKLTALLDAKQQRQSRVAALTETVRTLKRGQSRASGDVVRLNEELKRMSGRDLDAKKQKLAMEATVRALRQKSEAVLADLSAVTSARDAQQVQLSESQRRLSESEMARNQLTVERDSATAMAAALKAELGEVRRSTVPQTRYHESHAKCKKLRCELAAGYEQIDALSLSLDSTKAELNKLSAQSVPLSAYEQLSGSVAKMERENLAQAQQLGTLRGVNERMQSELERARADARRRSCQSEALREQNEQLERSLGELGASNRELSENRSNLKRKYKKIKGSLDELSATTAVNQDLIRSNQFLRKELGALVNQTPLRMARECANSRCNRHKGTYLKIHPKTLAALKKTCNL